MNDYPREETNTQLLVVDVDSRCIHPFFDYNDLFHLINLLDIYLFICYIPRPLPPPAHLILYHIIIMSASRKKSSSSIKTETNNKPTTKKQDALNKEFVKIFEENGLDKMAKEVGIA